MSLDRERLAKLLGDNRLSRRRTSADPRIVRPSLPVRASTPSRTTTIVSRVNLRSEPAPGRSVRQHAAPAEPVASAALAAVAGAAADLHSRRNCHEHPKLRSQQLRDNRTVKEPPRRRCDGDQGALHRRVLLVRLPSPASLRDQRSPRVRRGRGEGQQPLGSYVGRGPR